MNMNSYYKAILKNGKEKKKTWNTIFGILFWRFPALFDRSKLDAVSTEALIELAGVPNEWPKPSTRREDVLKPKGTS